MSEDQKLIDELIEVLKLENVRQQGDEIRARCPSPVHEDYDPSWFLNLYKGVHHCFSCNFSGRLEDVLVDIGKMRRPAAKLMVLKLRGKQSIEDDVRWPVTEEMIEPFTTRASQYAIDRMEGNWKIINQYRVGIDPYTNYPAFITRDPYGRPTGVWVQTFSKPKYKLIGPLDAKNRGAIFGAHLKPTRMTIVAEGFYQTMAICQATGIKTVGILGTEVSDEQRKVLEAMAPLTLMLDGDNPGRTARTKLAQELSSGVEVYVCGGYTGDPDNFTPQEIWSIFDAKKSRIEYLKKEGLL